MGRAVGLRVGLLGLMAVAMAAGPALSAPAADRLPRVHDSNLITFHRLEDFRRKE